MSHSISATEKIYVFNALVKASEDVVPGEIVKGSVYFDTTQPNLNLQEITVIVESLEYHVSPPTASANAADAAVADAANVKNANSDHHHKGFLDFFKRHGKAPGLSLNIASHVQNDSNKFELVVPITTAPAIINAGRHEYPFEVTIPTNIPVTSAVQKNADDVVLLLYRYHAVIKIEGATEDGEAFHVLHVLAK
ncbi:hypothetical protein HDU82_008916 [Entophlyctis luteolus]|nr:hypothetical protein HDU82_008916 [Entophlyctis luteolus]